MSLSMGTKGTKLSIFFLKKRLNNMVSIVLENEVFSPFCPHWTRTMSGGRIVSIIYWRIDSINFGRNTR
jgi:hypothetical protein